MSNHLFCRRSQRRTGIAALFLPVMLPLLWLTAGWAAPTPTAPVPIEPPASEVIRFAVIGDYGRAGDGEAAVAAMVAGWQPDFVITTGDNNYDIGAAKSIDRNIGQYYHSFIAPYTGEYGACAEINRFFPVLGNHDWLSDQAQPYLDYFTLPGNERYYQFRGGSVDLFALDSDYNEPDGISSDSLQADWLKKQLAESTAPWKLVYFHVPPYSSGHHGSAEYMRWSFAEWGATAVLTGHDHDYERLSVEGIPYFVNGLGGAAIYNFAAPLDESEVRYHQNYGAMLVTADETRITFEFYTVEDARQPIDRYSITSEQVP